MSTEKKPIKIKEVLRDEKGKFLNGGNLVGGRKIGAHGAFNRLKRNQFEAMREALSDMNFDVISEIVNVARYAENEKTRLDAMKALLERQYPILKSIELNSEVGATFALKIVQANGKVLMDNKPEIAEIINDMDEI